MSLTPHPPPEALQTVVLVDFQDKIQDRVGVTIIGSAEKNRVGVTGLDSAGEFTAIVAVAVCNRSLGIGQGGTYVPSRSAVSVGVGSPLQKTSLGVEPPGRKEYNNLPVLTNGSITTISNAVATVFIVVCTTFLTIELSPEVKHVN